MKSLCSLVLIVLILGACARIDRADTLRLNLSCEPATLDWNKASDAFSFDVISALMHGLTRYSANAEGEIIVEPMIARSWQVNAAQDAYSFQLDPSAKWSDGVPVTAQQFVDSFRRVLEPSTAAPYAELLSLIDLEQTKAVDDHTLYIKLKKSAPYFIYLSACGLTLPIRKDLIDKYGAKWIEPEHLITNGPYRLTKWQHEYKIELERSNNYWRQPPSVKRIKFFMVAEQSQAYTLFKNHQIDFVDNRSLPSSELRDVERKLAAGEHLLRKPLLRSTYVGFNNRIVDLHLRKALFYSINRHELVAALKRGYKASASWIPPGLVDYYNPDLANPDQAYNPDLARREFKLAKIPANLVFAFPSTEEARMISETLQAMWRRELGLTVELRSMEWKAYLNALDTNPPAIFRMNWTADYPDPDSFMQLFMINNPINYPGFHNAEYDRIVEQAARLSIDSPERRRLYRRAEEILLKENAVVAPIFTNTQTIIHRNNIDNLDINAMDMLFLDKITKHE